MVVVWDEPGDNRLMHGERDTLEWEWSRNCCRKGLFAISFSRMWMMQVGGFGVVATSSTKFGQLQGEGAGYRTRKRGSRVFGTLG